MQPLSACRVRRGPPRRTSERPAGYKLSQAPGPAGSRVRSAPGRSRREPVTQRSHRVRSHEERADCRNVRNGIHCPDFVEMDLVHRHAVHMAFRFRNQTENIQNVLTDLFGQIQMIFYDMFDIMHAMVHMAVCMTMVMMVIEVVLMLMVMMMFMFMVVLIGFFLDAADRHVHMRARNSTLDRLLRRILYIRDPQRIQFRKCRFPVRQQFQQCCRQHIARSTHAAV